MAERLTKFNKTGWVLKLDEPQNEFEARQQLMSKFKLACKKLAQLEDIMEKYDIESFELLEHIIKKGKVINSVIEDFAKEEYDKMKQDRNTWKRACELACQIIISGCCDCIEDTTDWDSAVEEWKEYNGIETYGIGVEELLGYLLEKAKKEGSDE